MDKEIVKKEILLEFDNLPKNIKDLQKFHAINKYLYFCFDIEVKNKLGKIASNKDGKVRMVFEEYRIELINLFKKDVTLGKIRNSLTHMLGYFKKYIKKEEYKFILEKIENLSYENLKYIKNKIIYYSKKFEIDYIKGQSIFRFLY